MWGRYYTKVTGLPIHLFSASKSFVKKKAALTLLRLYRKHPDVIPAVDWSERLIALLDEPDLVINIYSRLCVKFCVYGTFNSINSLMHMFL